MTYGKDARVGNKIVFSKKGAADYYRILCRLSGKYRTMEASAIASEASLDLRALGFTWEEIEAIELEAIS